jgi:indole-3-glycerol phosphate synthase
MPNTSLDAILATTRIRIDALRPRAAELDRRAAARPAAPAFGPGLSGRGVGLIAEVKRRSPSAGAIALTLDPVSHATAYVRGGAVAISVLTDEAHFGGSVADLDAVSRAVRVPTLRKDFILDVLQLVEARGAGAAAVLLIVRALDPSRLRALARAARDLGLATLIEVHHESELEPALAAEPTAIGVNNRDLDSFRTDLAVGERLIPLIPPQVLAVAESGIETREDVERMAAAGADVVLVGTALARVSRPEGAVAELVGVVRHPR